LLIALLAMAAALMGWLVENYAIADGVLFRIAIGVTFGVAGAIVWVSRNILRRAKQLEDL
jgi:hypothetical protein